MYVHFGEVSICIYFKERNELFRASCILCMQHVVFNTYNTSRWLKKEIGYPSMQCKEDEALSQVACDHRKWQNFGTLVWQSPAVSLVMSLIQQALESTCLEVVTARSSEAVQTFPSCTAVGKCSGFKFKRVVVSFLFCLWVLRCTHRGLWFCSSRVKREWYYRYRYCLAQAGAKGPAEAPVGPGSGKHHISSPFTAPASPSPLPGDDSHIHSHSAPKWDFGHL